MRALLAGAAFAALLAGKADAQPGSPQNASGRNDTRAAGVADGLLGRTLAAIRDDVGSFSLPDTSAFVTGDRAVAADEHITGSIATFRGDLEIRGTVDGDAIAVLGDVIVLPGAKVGGNAVAVQGAVRGGGAIAGATVTLTDPTNDIAPFLWAGEARPAPPNPQRTLALAAGTMAILLSIGLAVHLLAGRNLDNVTDTLGSRFGVSFLAGLLGQLALLPAAVVLTIALAITILGILLIPFALVALLLGAAGAITLGYLAAAHVAGAAIWPGEVNMPPEGRRSAPAMLVGVVVLMFPWLVAAALPTFPLLGGALRGVALTVTWVAATAGFGSVLLSFGGTRAPRRIANSRALATAMASIVLLVAAAAPMHAQAWRSLDVARGRSDSGPLEMNIEYDVGRLAIEPAVQAADLGALYHARLRYDAARTQPVHRFDPSPRVVWLGARDTARVGSPEPRGFSSLRLSVSEGVPTALSLQLGAVEGDVELGGLSLTDVHLRSGASKMEVRFSRPNAVMMNTLDLDAGAASLEVFQTANANAGHVRVKTSVGFASVDFGGTWTRDIDAELEVTLGRMEIRVPPDVGIQLTLDQVLGSAETGGLRREGTTYYSTNWESAPHKLRIRARTVLGKFEITQTAR